MRKFKNLEEIERHLSTAVPVDKLSDEFSEEAYNVWALKNELTEVFVGSGEGFSMTQDQAKQHVKRITEPYLRRGSTFRLPRKYVRQIVQKTVGNYLG